MNFTTELTEAEKVQAEQIIELILSNGTITEVANICCYGDFVGETDMTVFHLGTLVMKALRAIEALGGEQYRQAVAAFACDMERREQFDDHIARQCFLQKMAWAGAVVRVQQ
jgi:hypothetical protein